MQFFLFHQLVARQVLDLAYIFTSSSMEVKFCGRYSDDAHFIHTSVTASTSVMGSHSKLPSSVIILINGQLFSLGSRVCT